ncbi:MAG: T9SS type A sorting domain-containing protein [Bacteroidales bacterium]|nr:T9SS type A sorting domain-containing protein [Bacteroidales bacterium]
MKSITFILMLLTAAVVSLYAQQSANVQHATYIGISEQMVERPSIASQIANGTFVPAENIEGEVNPKRRGANLAVPGKGLPLGNDPLWEQQTKTPLVNGREPILTFEAASANATPTDPTGAVGPNHFMNAWNTSFRIWDKSGNPLTDPASLGTIWPGETAGDPIVFYDPFADRFLITQFTFLNGFLVAISQGPDPVNDGWYTYQFLIDAFPDYPKFSVWSDGYYITANKNSGSAGTSEVVFAIERDEIIAGNPDAQIVGFPLTDIVTSGFYSPLGFNANGATPPPPGNAPIVYMQDDSWSGVTTDHLKIWSINVDWETPDNSTISSPQIINTAAFDGLFDGGSFSNLPQPSGPDLDALQATIMYMAQYRRFSDHNSAVFNFVVDLDGNDDYSGIRWYELRQTADGDPWTIYQEGTYSQPDGHSAYCGNMCMDVDGNIALAYSVVSTEVYPSLRYTGRFASDPLGVMTIAEDEIVAGVQSDPSNRYGDYAQMTIDPVDDKTFWSIGEYFSGNSRKNQVGVFKIASDFTNDVGVISIDAPVDGILGAADSIKVTVRNFGADTQSNIPVSYQIDSGNIITETITDSIPSNTDLQYTFSVTGDFSVVGQTYNITSWTALATDENNANDTTSSNVTNLFPNDIGVTGIQAPVSGSGLTSAEPVMVLIKNFGGAAQWGFDVAYSVDNSTPITETVEDTLSPGTSLTYTFDSTADLSQMGEYAFTAYTSLPGDADLSNDTSSKIVKHTICQPGADCTEGDGIHRLELSNIINSSGCDPDGYGDYTDLIALVETGPYNDLIITTNYGNQHVRVWIDLNDNFIFEDDEVMIEDEVIAPGSNGGVFTETLLLDIPYGASLGEHIMRVKTNWDSPVPGDACQETEYGETEDYTVDISPTTGVTEQVREPNELNIFNKGNKQFELSFRPVKMEETLVITVHNINGQKLIQNRVEKQNGKYIFRFDMSYAKPGMYLVRLGTAGFGKVKKIIVN